MEKTINEVFYNRAQKYGDRLAVEKNLNGTWESATWNEYYERARATGLGLHSLGVNRGDRISLLSENRLEWLYTDMGALGIGACVVPVYTTLSHEEVSYIVNNSGSRVLIVEDAQQLEKAMKIVDSCPSLEKIVLIDESESKERMDVLLSFAELLEAGRKNHEQDPDFFRNAAVQVTEDDLATIVYTSGTTGVPKGAMISHKNIMAVIRGLDQTRPQYAVEGDSSVPFLPLSHVFERVAGHWYGMFVGITSSYAESIDTIVRDIQDKKPTVVLAVPRVCEKVYQRIINQVQESPVWKQKVFYWGQKIGSRISECREQKKKISPYLKLRYKIAYKMIFENLNRALGGRVRWMTASGAPTAKEILHFFNAAGIMVIEGYGMTECTAPATMSNLADYRIGTVGRPLPGVDIKIADDGEILIKGDNVVRGYWEMPEETREAFTEDGYMMSGDIGVFDSSGFLMITDRKKDLIITAGGKNVAPQKIEQLFISDPLFLNFVVIGDRRKFLSALCNINFEQAEREAEDRGISFQEPVDLLDNEEFIRIIDEHVEERNSHLARYESIKKYRIIKHEFSQETGELTPSLKLKRKVIREKYKDLIEEMYRD